LSSLAPHSKPACGTGGTSVGQEIIFLDHVERKEKYKRKKERKETEKKKEKNKKQTSKQWEPQLLGTLPVPAGVAPQPHGPLGLRSA
jgi:hypothetical protein